MEYTIENEYLKVTVMSYGAQIKSVLRKCDGTEHMWRADKDVWGYHSPILFPYTGRVVEDKIIAKGREYPGPKHGIARLQEYDFLEQSGDSIALELCSSPETLAVFPYEFRLVSTFTLENDTLHHTLTVENLDGEKLPFGIGFHPAFAVPFDDRHTVADYELRFEEMESPLCIGCMPNGLVHGDCYYLGSNIRSIALDEKLFANDSHCMTNLRSGTLGLYEKGTGRAVVCDIRDFPYTLIWSKPGMPQFVCIEPWHSIPSAEGSSLVYDEKPAAAILEPGEAWSTTLSMRFVR